MKRREKERNGMEDKKITVIMVEPMKKPEVIDIGTDLEDMEAIVGGEIELTMPFEEDIAVVTNMLGKRLNLSPNRAIYNETGHIKDIIAGTFIITYAPIGVEDFVSLPKAMQEKYMEKFRYPEQFLRTVKGIKVIPMKPVREEMQR